MSNWSYTHITEQKAFEYIKAHYTDTRESLKAALNILQADVVRLHNQVKIKYHTKAAIFLRLVNEGMSYEEARQEADMNKCYMHQVLHRVGKVVPNIGSVRPATEQEIKEAKRLMHLFKQDWSPFKLPTLEVINASKIVRHGRVKV